MIHLKLIYFLSSSRTPPQELCDVDIKEETSETINEHFNSSYQDQFVESTNNNNNNSELSNYQQHSINGERLLAAVTQSPSQTHNRSSNADNLKRLRIHSPLSGVELQEQNALNFMATGNSDLGAFQPTFTMSNISATLEALNALRNGQFTNAAIAAAAMQKKFAAAAQRQVITTPPPLKRARTSSTSAHSDAETPGASNAEGEPAISQQEQQGQESQLQEQVKDQQENHSITKIEEILNQTEELDNNATERKDDNDTNSTEIRDIMNMQKKEHSLRMKILEVQLQAAKHNRDLIEINKTFALQRLQEFASRRLAN